MAPVLCAWTVVAQRGAANVVVTKVFAEGYEKNEHGWYLFPRDAPARRELFVPEVMDHPAKMSFYLLQEIVKYNTEPGESILDCFGGSGTTMWAALYGRPVTLLELEPAFVEMARATMAKWDAEERPHAPILVLHGDNRQLLPIPTDHMVFSPPYANDMAKTTGGALNEQVQASVDLYTNSALNLGRLNEFLYTQAMGKVYDGVRDSVRAGGTVTITHRDRSRTGRRILFADTIIRHMTTRGFELKDWFKWHPPGSIQAAVNRKRGADVIEDEDILMFRRLG